MRSGRVEADVFTEEHWNAIISNDASFDGKFYYAVATTGIFCRPSCKSRVPNKAHIRIYPMASLAILNNYRPCKRCKPEMQEWPDEAWVEQIVGLIESRWSEPITLATLAGWAHGSPYHLQRTFKRIKGITPTAYIQQIRLSKAKQFLSETSDSIREIARRAGFLNAAYYTIVFQAETGFTPTVYRQTHSEFNS